MELLGVLITQMKTFYSFFGPNRSPGANGLGYSNPEFDKLFKVASVLQDSPKRTSMYETMYKMAAEEVPWIYGVQGQSYVVKNHGLKLRAFRLQTGMLSTGMRTFKKKLKGWKSFKV